MSRGLSKLGRHGRRFPNSGSLRARLALALALLPAWGALTPAWAADTGNGRSVYEKHCVLCHGAQGQPSWPGAPDFRRAASVMKPDAQLLNAIRYGKGTMPAYVGVLKDKDALDVTAYLRTLTR